MYLVSSCLAGVKCRYNGSCSKNNIIETLIEEGKAFAVCPEIFAGLPTPRPSCEIQIDKNGNKKVIGADGNDYTKYFNNGALKTLEIAKILNIKIAILQSRSPSCGFGKIYDGQFSGNFITGNGLTAELLSKNKIKIYTEEDIDKLKL